MGQRLVDYFEHIKQEGGYPARLRLCMALELPSAKARETTESEELLHKCHDAAEEILGKPVPMF